jgi:hypothetical protein
MSIVSRWVLLRSSLAISGSLTSMTSAAATLPRDTTRLAFRWWQAGDEALAEELWGDGRVTALIDARPSLDRAAVA